MHLERNDAVLWKKLIAPALLALTLSTAAVSAASAAATPAPTDAIEAQADLPGQTAPGPDGLERPRITDPKVACEHQELHVALIPLCGIWLPKTLPADQQEAIGHVIVRVANLAAHAPKIRERLAERCERYLAAHPDENNLRTRLCKRIVAGEKLTPEELRDLREERQDAKGAENGQRKQRPGLQGTPGQPRGPRPAVTATPAS